MAQRKTKKMPSTINRDMFRTRGKNLGEIREFPEAALQSFKKNDVCYVSASGTLTAFLAAGNTGTTATTGGTELVIALSDATATTGNRIKCLVPSQEFEMLLVYVNGTAQIDSVQTAIGDELGLRFVASGAPAGATTNIWGADAASTSNNIVKLVEFDRTTDVVGTAGNYHMVWCKFLDAARFGR